MDLVEAVLAQLRGENACHQAMPGRSTTAGRTILPQWARQGLTRHRERLQRLLGKVQALEAELWPSREVQMGG